MITALRNTVSFAIAATATLLIVAGSAAPVTAAEATISVSGIDLATPAGTARITSEITRTARRLCNTGDTRSAAGTQRSRACIETAVANARPQLEQLAANARGDTLALADVALPTNTVRR